MPHITSEQSVNSHRNLPSYCIMRTIHVFRLVYLALIQFVLQYGILGWGCCFNTEVILLILVQKKNLKYTVHRCGASGSMRACHAAGPGSIPGRDRFPGWGFFGFFLTCKTNVRKLKVPEYHLAVVIIIPCRLVGMTECVLGVYCLSCLCCLGGGPGIGLITHPGRPSMSLCGQKSMSVIHSRFS